MTLQEAIALVSAEHATLQVSQAGYTYEKYDEWRRERDASIRAAALRLTQAGAVIRDDWRGAVFRFAGIRTSCTGGLSGALGNWLKRAEGVGR